MRNNQPLNYECFSIFSFLLLYSKPDCKFTPNELKFLISESAPKITFRSTLIIAKVHYTSFKLKQASVKCCFF